MKAIVGGICVVLAAAAVGGCASSSPSVPSASTQPPAALAGEAGGTSSPAGSRGAPVAGAGTDVAGGTTTHTTEAAWSADDRVVATVGNRSIRMGQLLSPLLESHGLTTLLTVVQLELAKQGVEDRHLSVTPQDLQSEREQMLGKLFREFDEKIDEKIELADRAKRTADAERLRKEKEDGHRQLTDQFFTQQRITEGEFDLLIETNANLRKIADAVVEQRVTEEMIQKEFAARYGEKVRVRHMQFLNPQEVAEAQRRLAAGQDFKVVARTLSRNRQSAALDGELPPFSRGDMGVPQIFKDVAFALKVGEVSSMVSADNSYHLIRLEERIAPKAVKIETVHDAIARDLHEVYIDAIMRGLREKIGDAARQGLKIEQPILDRQFKEKLAVRDAQVNKEKALAEIEKERQRRLADERAANPAAAARGTTQPATATQPWNVTPDPLPGVTLPPADPTQTIGPAAMPQPAAGRPGVGAAPPVGPPPPATIEQRIQTIRTVNGTPRPPATRPAGAATRPAGASPAGK